MNVLRPFLRTAHTTVELQYSVGFVVLPAGFTSVCVSTAVHVRNATVTHQARPASSSSHPLPRLEPAVGRGGELEVTRALMNTIVSEIQEDIPRALPVSVCVQQPE